MIAHFSLEDGDVELKLFWQDSEFRRDQNALLFTF